jgi:hypothetical protein
MARMRTLALGAMLVAWTTALGAQNPYPPSPADQNTGGVAPALFVDPNARPITPPATVREAVPLTRSEPRPQEKLPLRGPPSADSVTPRSTFGSGIVGVLASLGIVLGAFLAVVAFMRRGMPKGARTLPAEAVEVLGRLTFPGRQQGHLIRVGNKITLVSFSSGGAEALLEITDPIEVDRLSGLCRQHDPRSSTNSFRSIVEQFFHEKPSVVTTLPPAAERDDA